jgi:GNAT superfamily N-acetyltransferase
VGLGYSLLQHATTRALEAADTIGIRAILVHALNDTVVAFYEKFGFTRFPNQSHTLYLLTKDARATLDSL